MIQQSDNLALEFSQLPTVCQNPNPSVPLAAVVHFSANKTVQTTIELDDGENKWEIKFSKNPADGLPIVGMRPSRSHRLSISIQDTDGNVVQAPAILTYTTPPLPTDRKEFPPIRVTVSNPNQMEPGVTLVSIRRRYFGLLTSLTLEETNFLLHFGLLAALDAEGEVVWYHRIGVCISDFTQLQNGNILYLTLDQHIVEIDLLGNVIASWYSARGPYGASLAEAMPVDVLSFHHFLEELPNGNIIAFASVAKTIEDYWASETDPDAPKKPTKVMGDDIVEFQRDGTVVWRWNAFDWLDPYRMGYETLHVYWRLQGFPDHADWTHGNGLWFDKSDDSLIISLRHQDALLKIDRKTGEIIWILGEHINWSDSLQKKLLHAEEGMRWPYHTHAPSITPHGTILVFDNGNYRTHPFKPPLPPQQSYSRAVEYEIDTDAMTVRQVWESDAFNANAMVTYAMGDADWLPHTGNVLVTYGFCYPNEEIPAEIDWMSMTDLVFQTRIREVAHTNPPEIVWEIRLDEDGGEEQTHSWQTYGADRLPGLYKSGVV